MSSSSHCLTTCYYRKMLEKHSISTLPTRLSSLMKLTVCPSFTTALIPDLIDTLLSIYSTNLTSIHLASALSQLEQYLSRFRNRLKPIHALKIKQTLAVLKGLTRVCDKFMQEVKSPDWKGKSKAEMMDGNTLMSRVGGGSDQVNIMEMVSYLKESKLARKVSGFAENQAEVAMKNGTFISLLLR
jgi:hypothetical protein